MRVLRLQTDSRPESLGDARRRVRGVMLNAGLGVDAARGMEIAVGEALSNVHEHAYRAAVGPVLIEVLRTSSALTIVVSDEGRATVAPSVPRTLPPRTAHGGHGLYMAARLADDVDIRVNPAGHGVTVRMMARLPRATAPSDGTGRDGATT